MKLPSGEKLQRAVQRFVEERSARPDVPLARVVDEVCLRFDLDPSDSEWLLRNAARVEAEAREGAIEDDDGLAGG